MSDMVNKNLIYTGDTTTHGGTLNDGFASSTRNGVHRCVAVGHGFWCPTCQCWSKFIEGASNFTVYGQARVLEGHRTSCGAAAIHRLGFNDTAVDSVGSGRSAEIIKFQEARAAAQANQGGAYSHCFNVHNPTDHPLEFIVFKDGALLDVGISGKDLYGSGRSAKVNTHQGEKVYLAVKAPRPKLK